MGGPVGVLTPSPHTAFARKSPLGSYKFREAGTSVQKRKERNVSAELSPVAQSALGTPPTPQENSFKVKIEKLLSDWPKELMVETLLMHQQKVGAFKRKLEEWKREGDFQRSSNSKVSSLRMDLEDVKNLLTIRLAQLALLSHQVEALATDLKEESPSPDTKISLTPTSTEKPNAADKLKGVTDEIIDFLGTCFDVIDMAGIDMAEKNTSGTAPSDKENRSQTAPPIDAPHPKLDENQRPKTEKELSDELFAITARGLKADLKSCFSDLAVFGLVVAAFAALYFRKELAAIIPWKGFKV